jgi:transcriptional regulator with XRE-family HTH domain
MNKKEIKQFLKDTPAVSKRDLCREAGITPLYLNMILRDERPLTKNVINKIKPVLHKYGITQTNRIMTTDRIKEIQSKTAYPESVSVQQALLQVWNECEQEQLRLHVKNKNSKDMKDKLTIISDDLNHDIITELEARKQLLILLGVSTCTDLEWSLYKQVVNLKEEKKKLEFMIENGLGWKDMENDI